MKRVFGVVLAVLAAVFGTQVVMARAGGTASPRPPATITFGSPITLPLPQVNQIGPDGYGLAVADVDHDGNPDVLVSDLNHTRILIYLGDGQGAFTVQPDFISTAGHPAHIATGDFNQDGDIDVVFANYHSRLVSVAMGNGDGTFDGRSDYPVLDPQDVVVADFNNDTWPDIAAADSPQGLAVLLNNQDGTFFKSSTYFTTVIGDHTQIAAADFNDDGLVDLADHSVVRLNTGAGLFGDANDYGTPCSNGGANVTTGDLNEDGIVDLIIGARGDCHSLTVLLGNGDGTFSIEPGGRPSGDFEAGVRVMDLAAADFDGDGHQDIVMVGSTESFFKILPGRGDGTFDAGVNVPMAGVWGKHLAVADFDHDGRPDVVVTQAADPAVYLNTTEPMVPPDSAPPTVNCAAVDGVWHANDVSLLCTASDSGSGLANAGDASFFLTTSVPTGIETANAVTNSRVVCDVAGNCATAGPIGGNMIDKLGPTVSLTAPANTSYTLNQIVTASFNCNDGGAGLSSCTGTVANGSAIDTSSVGTRTFSVDASDPVGNTSTTSVTYTVSLGGAFTAVTPASIWLGLKNSDDVGTKFDLLAEVLNNGVVVGSGQLNNVPGGSSGFNNAAERAIATALSGATTIAQGQTLSIRLSVRIAVGVTGHRSGTARLWFGDAVANSRINTVVNGVSRTFYLTGGFTLSPSPGAGPRATIDVLVDRAVGGNPFKPFGTWSITF